MTELAQALIRRIAATGPITLADYMGECLFHPDHGYYTQSPVFGAAGDFTTAPEISQMYGELLGLALAQSWLDRGSPAPFLLVELGPGRGTLMADVLRATRAVPGFHAALQLWLVEASPRLRALQRQVLAPHAVQWADRIEDVPPGPLFLLANEFFDALPIRQFRREGDLWAERMVGLADGQLAFGWSAPLALAALQPRLADTAPGDIVETCAPGEAVAAEIGARIAKGGGLAYLVDYGDWSGTGDTFQALSRHAFADPLAAPGQADLTAHVAFAPLAAAARPAAHRFATQGEFLQSLGIATRAERLAARLSGEALSSHLAAFRRLTGPQEMGTLFKVLALFRKDDPAPPGMPAHA